MDRHYAPLLLDDDDAGVRSVGQREADLAELYAHMRSSAQLPLVSCLGALPYDHSFFVEGRGPLDAQLLVLGGVPSVADSQHGRAFSDDEGRLLASTLAPLFGDSIFYMHVVSVHPLADGDGAGDSREPSFTEVCSFAGYALQQVLLVRPRVILALGSLAATLVRRQFAPDRLLDARDFVAHRLELKRVRCETLDEALAVHRALRERRLADVRGSDALGGGGLRGVYAFDAPQDDDDDDDDAAAPASTSAKRQPSLKHARLQRESLHRLRLEDRASVLTVASCGFAVRTLVCESPSDYFALARTTPNGATLVQVREWLERCEPALRRLRMLARPPIFMLEPENAPFPPPANGYARVPAYDQELVRSGARGAAQRQCANRFLPASAPRAPTMHELDALYGAEDAVLLFQMNDLTYNQRDNCYEAFGRTHAGLSVCARIAHPRFEFAARLVHWAWVEWWRSLSTPAERRAEEAWLREQVETYFESIVGATPHYVSAARGEKWGRRSDASDLELHELRELGVCVVDARSLYYITDRDEPFVCVEFRHKASRSAVEHAVTSVLSTLALERALARLGAPPRVASSLAPRVELFELDSDPVQQFCMRTGVATSGWCAVRGPLSLVPDELRHSYCQIEVLADQDDVRGVMPSTSARPSYAQFGFEPTPRSDPALCDRVAALARLLPERWNANAPYVVMSMDIEALPIERGKFPDPALCPVLSVCAYEKTFDQREGRVALREEVCANDSERKVRQSGCVDYDGAVVFALKHCGALVPRLYDPATHPDSVHAATPGVREAFSREHAAYRRALGIPARDDAYDFNTRYLLAHFAQRTLDDALTSDDERAAARALVGSRALQRYRLGVVDGAFETGAPWRRLGLLLPAQLDQCRCRCGCERVEHAACATFESALAALLLELAPMSPVQHLTRAERHLVLFTRSRFEGAHAWLFAEPRRLLEMTRPRSPLESEDAWREPGVEGGTHGTGTGDKQEAWTWRSVALELCATLPELAEPHHERLTWRLVGRVLPDLLEEIECACCARTPRSDRARCHVLRSLEPDVVSALAKHERIVPNERGVLPLGAFYAPGTLLDQAWGRAWREPGALSGGAASTSIDWDSVLEQLAAKTPGLVELGGLVDEDDAPLGGVHHGEALSTWNAPPYEWLRDSGSPLLARFARLYPRAHDTRHILFEPTRLVRALLQSVEAPAGYEMGAVEKRHGETHYALAEAARRTHWYAYRPEPRVYEFESEHELLEAWAHYTTDLDPDFVSGYNIKKFDYRYLLERARVLGVAPERFGGVYQLGRMRNRPCDVTYKMFESRAYGQREIVDVVMSGRCVVDMLDYAQREKKWPSYKLGYASSQMLGDTKDDVPHTVLYSLFMRDRERLHRYCLKDAELCMRMLVVDNVVDFALDMVKLISALCVGALYVRGQQARVVSLLLRSLRTLAASPGGIRYLLPTQRTHEGRGPGDAMAERAAVTVAPDAARLRQEACARMDAESTSPLYDARAALEATRASFVQRYAKHLDPAAADEYVRVDALVEEARDAAYDADVGADEAIEGALGGEHEEDEAYERAFGDKSDADAGDEEAEAPVASAREAVATGAGSSFSLSAEPQYGVEASAKRRKTGVETAALLMAESANSFKRKGKAASKVAYEGAFVFDPVRGLCLTVTEISGTHRRKVGVIVCLDYTSLYPNVMRSRNLSHDTMGTRRMFARLGRDVDAELAAGTLYKSPVQFADPDATSTVPELEDWFFDQRSKGVLTRVLTELLDARAAVRKSQKGVKGGSVAWYCFEGQQLACKLISNSTYGATGAREGRISCLVIGATVTAEGKATIMKVHDSLTERYPDGEFGTQCMGGDSVTGDTPLLVRHCASGARALFTVEEFESYIDGATECEHGGAWVTYGTEKEQIVFKAGAWETWSDGGFTPLHRLIRHRTQKRIVRVLTHTGCLDVTEDHSLLTPEGERIRPSECAIGTRLLHAYPTKFSAPSEIYSAFKVVPRDESEAFLWGLFLADGSCGSYECPSGKKASWAISKRDRDLLARAGAALESSEPHLKAKVLETIESTGALKLVPTSGGVYGGVARLVEKYRALFYNKSALKQVPHCILSAPRTIRQAFFVGYYSGDGGKTRPYMACGIKGKIGAAGLFYLATSLGWRVTINTDPTREHIFYLSILDAVAPKKSARKDPFAIKKLYDIAPIGDRYVYDLETTSHHFGAGIGSLIPHNTDSVFFRLGHLGSTQDVGRWVCEVEDFCNTLVEPPMRIEFEKEYDGYLAFAPKRYAFNNVGFDARKTYWTLFDEEDERMCESVNAHAAKHGRAPPFDIQKERTKKWKRLRMNTRSELKGRGLETVRRDSCEYVRQTLKRVLVLTLEKRSPERAVAYARKAAQRLLDGRVPLAQLVMSKHYSKTEYKTRSLPHLTILRKCHERSLPAPELGSRIAFLVCRGNAREKACERAEDVEYVLEHSLPVDYEYYLENQFKKPVLRILDWVCGFVARSAPKKRYAIDLAMKPLLMAPVAESASRSISEYFGGAKRERVPQYAHVLHLAKHAVELRELCVAATADALVYAGPVARRPGQHYFRCGSAREPPAVPAPLLALRGVTHVATKHVQRENGFEYVSVAEERVFGGLASAQRSSASSTASTNGLLRYARVSRPCAACGASSFFEVCDACVVGRREEAELALGREERERRDAYDRTLPVCRRCSGDYDESAQARIACVNTDCEHFFPRRVAEHALDRSVARCAAARSELREGAAGVARRAQLNW